MLWRAEQGQAVSNTLVELRCCVGAQGSAWGAPWWRPLATSPSRRSWSRCCAWSTAASCSTPRCAQPLNRHLLFCFPIWEAHRRRLECRSKPLTPKVPVRPTRSAACFTVNHFAINDKIRSLHKHRQFRPNMLSGNIAERALQLTAVLYCFNVRFSVFLGWRAVGRCHGRTGERRRVRDFAAHDSHDRLGRDSELQGGLGV